MPESIVLYDLARRDSPNKCWSYNVWKTRLALNYKGIPYTTMWIDHNTLAPTLKGLGVPANISGQGFEYTVPTVKFTDDSMITDSGAIAVKLEQLYPDSPSLHLDPELQARADKIVHSIAMPLFAIYMPRVVRNVIEQSTAPAFRATREQRFGMSLEEMEIRRGGEQAWIAAEPGFKALARFLSDYKRDDGPWIYGSQPCYADFILVALFEAFKRVEQDMFVRAVAYHSSFEPFYHAAEKWLKNDE